MAPVLEKQAVGYHAAAGQAATTGASANRAPPAPSLRTNQQNLPCASNPVPCLARQPRPDTSTERTRCGRDEGDLRPLIWRQLASPCMQNQRTGHLSKRGQHLIVRTGRLTVRIGLCISPGRYCVRCIHCTKQTPQRSRAKHSIASGLCQSRNCWFLLTALQVFPQPQGAGAQTDPLAGYAPQPKPPLSHKQGVSPQSISPGMTN